MVRPANEIVHSGGIVATRRQKAAARKNIKKAAKAARAKKTISRLPRKTRTALGKQGAKVAKRKGRTG
jgi:ABC-type protease/lipase transport system fused ATPase/permease subunit